MKPKYFFIFSILVHFTANVAFSAQSEKSEVKVLRKINETGQFLPYPGTTVVSPVQPSKLWHEIHEKLSQDPLISHYFSVLPETSYHMTLMSLFNENGTPNWHDFINRHLPWFQRLHTSIQSMKLQPRGAWGSPVTSVIIYLPIYLDKSTTTKILHLASEYQIEGKVPDFHVTLAYAYKPIPKETWKEIDLKAQELLRPLLSSHGSTIALEEPRLCYFRSMKEFTPWDGNTNPF